jgi:hypothetical protein
MSFKRNRTNPPFVPASSYECQLSLICNLDRSVIIFIQLNKFGVNEVTVNLF